MDFKNKVILLVEDEAVNAFLVKNILEPHNLEIIHAKNGLEAITLYEKHKVEIKLILLDISIPILNGYEVFDKIRKDNKDVFIIAMTAHVDDRAYCMKLGFNDFVPKPFNIKYFMDMLNRFIG